MTERLNATLLIDGQPLADDVRLDVYICNICGGKGQRMVTTGMSMDGTGKVERYQQMHPCVKCRRSGYVIHLTRDTHGGNDE